ncbi:hypothetical protein NDA14_007546 [Ustilago hordei]|nr:hypothetical protein NDA14_007546 [Ustilago hordei]
MQALFPNDHRRSHQDLCRCQGDVLRGLQAIEVACSTTSTPMEECIKVSENMDTYSRRECLGITAAIVPFNFSTMILLWSFPMATITRTTLILKPSKRVPSISMIIAERCESAGTPQRGVMSWAWMRRKQEDLSSHMKGVWESRDQANCGTCGGVHQDL